MALGSLPPLAVPWDPMSVSDWRTLDGQFREPPRGRPVLVCPQTIVRDACGVDRLAASLLATE